MRIRRVLIGLAGAVLVALAAAGCLEFDKQTIYFEHDQANDRLIMVIDYGGFYSDRTSGNEDLAQGQQQLDEAVKDHMAAFADNWPWLWSSSRIRKQMTDPNQNPGMAQSERDKVTRLTELVTVLNAGFYTDAAGRPCGAQVVIVEHASEALGLINDLINETTLDDVQKEGEHSAFDLLAIQAARNGHKWVALDGSSLIARVPMPEELLAQGWAEQIEEMLTEHEPARVPLAQRMRQFIASVPMFVWYQDGTLSLKVGLPSHPFTLTDRPRQGKYEPNLVDYVKQKYGFDLDARLAHYLQRPDAPATDEADRAAKLMAPRLTPEQRARVLVDQLQAAPSDALYDLLRKTPTPPEVFQDPEKANNEALLGNWEKWLAMQAAGPDTEKAKETP